MRSVRRRFDRKARVRGGKVEARLAVLELLADLADDHPILALSRQQRAEPFLADAIGRRGVDQVDAQFAGQGQQFASLGIVGDGEAAGVLHALVATQLDRAQTQRRNAQACAAQRAVQVMQRRVHGSSPSQNGPVSGGRGS